MNTIIHFSQDFQKGKSQLGGYSRIINICSDDNKHIIFTIDKKAKHIETWNISSNIQIVAIPLNGGLFDIKYQLIQYKKIARTINDYLAQNNIRVDVLFGHSQIVNFFILNYLKKQFKYNKLIWELNAIWGLNEVKGFSQKILNKIIKHLQKVIINRADILIAQTTASKEYLIDKFNALAEKIYVIENSVLSSSIKITNAVKPNDNFRYLCFGLFDKMNGIPFLLESANELRIHLTVDFYGTGIYLNEVKEMANLGIIRYNGSLPHQEMLEVITGFEFVIIPRLPEIQADLFIPTKLIECMACGVIPICSDVDGMTCVVKDGENGFIFKAGDKQNFIKVVEKVNKLNKKDYLKIKNNAIDSIRKKYTWEEKHKILNSIYNSLLYRNV